MNESTRRPIALYIHVPFCRARCLYCAFPSRPAGPDTQTLYVENICGEIKKYFQSNPDWSISTVYVGGGTPSTLNCADINLLLETIHSFAPDASEVTFEVNPYFDDIPKLPGLLKGGVNRLSVGVQTFNDTELALVGRLHTSDDVRSFLKECRETGFQNLSIDLIYGLPDQSVLSFENSLLETIENHPEHISLYALTVDPGSRLGRLPKGMLTGLNLPDGDVQAEMYDNARSLLNKSGFEQYEISNFCKPDYHCRHNLSYWFGDDYVGFGPGATSYVDGTRFRRLSDVDAYLVALRAGKNTVEYLETLSTDRAAAEAIVMGLRMAEGINRSSIETRFGVRISDLCGDVLDRYEQQGMLSMEGENIRLTDRAYFVSNAIFRDIIR